MLDATRPAALLTGDGLERARATRRPTTPDVAFVTWTSGTTGVPKPVLHTHANYLELLDRVLGPLRGARRRRATPDAPADAEPRPGLARAQRRHLQRVVRAARGRGDRRDGRLRPARVRRAGRAASRSARPCCRPPRWRCCPTTPTVVDLAPLRYVRSITAPLSPLQARRFADKFGVVVLNGYGQAEIGEVIGWTAADAREHPDKLGAVGRPHPGVAIRIAPPSARRCDRRSTAAPSGGCSCGRRRPRSAIARGPRRRRRLRRHRRPGARRRRRLRVDRGPRRRRHQSRRQQGVSRARRRGAAARARRRRGRGRRRARRPARRGPGRVRRRRPRRCPTTTSSPRAASTSRRTRSRSRSAASTRCRAARSARCCAASSRPAPESSRPATDAVRPGDGRDRATAAAGGSPISVAACAIRSRTHATLSSPAGIAASQPLMTAAIASRPSTIAEHLDGQLVVGHRARRCTSPMTSATSPPSGSRIA